jgi:hypothetical protein
MILSPTLARLLTHFFAFLYPAYQSFKAVNTNDVNSHASWLTYWIANSYFLVFEMFGDVVLSWIPFYYEAKLALLIWLVTPRFNGADKIYKQVIYPYLLKYEGDIDRSLESLKETGTEKLGDLADAGVRHIRAGSNEFIKIGHQALISGLLTAATSGIAPNNNAITNTSSSSSNVGKTTSTGGVTIQQVDDENDD